MRPIDSDALIECIKDEMYNRTDFWYKLIADALIKCIDEQDTIEIPSKEKLKNDYACLSTIMDMMYPYEDDPRTERTVVDMRIDDVQRAIIQAQKDLEMLMM